MSADSPPPPSAAGRIAGIDFGTVRVGVAITDRRRTLASPLEMYARRDRQQDADYFRRLAAEHQVVLFVVGLPVYLDGRESPKSAEARQFGLWLQQVTQVPVEFFDERFSTVQAEQFMAEGRLTSKRRKKRVDMLAAQVMLAAYLESPSKGQSAPGALDG